MFKSNSLEREKEKRKEKEKEKETKWELQSTHTKNDGVVNIW